jgi:circadian clock protein KaiC
VVAATTAGRGDRAILPDVERPTVSPPDESFLTAGLGVAGEGQPLPKLPSGVPGLDQITLGGLPEGRVTLVMGTAGTGKTMLGAQFLAQGAAMEQGSVFVSFEEPVVDLRRNLATIGWDIAAWEAAGRWAFVDGSPADTALGGTGVDGSATGDYPFATLVAQIGQAVDRTGATRVVLDSVNVALSDDRRHGRQQLRQLVGHLRRIGLTVVVTVEDDPDRSPTPSAGVEQFVVDSVILMRNTLEQEKRRRTLEVLKMRGAMHLKGEYPFTIFPDQGVVVIPLSVIELTQGSSNIRISSGNTVLDEICDGGFFRDSVVLVSGATGTGKTLMATEFLAGGVAAGERALLFAFEESRDQIFRNAAAWGHDFAAMEASGLLRVISTYPETASLEDHLVNAVKQITDFRPARVAIDSLSALERSGTPRGFQEFIIVLTSYIKGEQIAGLFTSSAPNLLGGTSATDGHISTLTDSIILLRYVERHSAVHRAVTVLKMRGSRHDQRIRSFVIDSTGMHIGEPFSDVSGILAGVTTTTGATPTDPSSREG